MKTTNQTSCPIGKTGRKENIMYNYIKEMRNDIQTYIRYNYSLEDLYEKSNGDLDKLYCILEDELWDCDDVTGNASGSYTFNRNKAREYISQNLELLATALEEFGDTPKSYKRALNDPEYADCTIRCYLLPNAIDDYIESIKTDFERIKENEELN